MEFVFLFMRRKIIRDPNKNDVQQIEVSTPVMSFQMVFFHQMNKTHAVDIHVHTDPDAEYPFNVIIIRANKISLFLRWYQTTCIEDRPV